MLKQLVTYGAVQIKWAIVQSVMDLCPMILIGLFGYLCSNYFLQKTIVWWGVFACVVLLVSQFLYVGLIAKKKTNAWGHLAKSEIKMAYLNSRFSYQNFGIANEIEVIQSDLKGLDKLDVYYEEFFPFVFKLVLGMSLFLLLWIINGSYVFWAACCYFLTIMLGVKAINQSGTEINRSHMKAFMQLGGRFLDDLAGMNTLIMYQKDCLYEERFYEDSEYFRRKTMQLLSYQLRSLFVFQFCLYINLTVSVILTILQIKNHRLESQESYGILLAFFYWMFATRKIGYFAHLVKSSTPSIKKILAVIQQNRDVHEERPTFKCAVTNISLLNTSFRYDESISSVYVSNANFHQGLTSIVGRNGVGKSTLAKLIMGELRPNAGEVRWNETNVTNISTSDRVKKIGYLGSNSFLFEGTIEENLQASLVECQDWKTIIQSYGLCTFIETLEKGYETQVGVNGKYLSPGQRQQITFSRLLLSDKDIYIFDEAASSIDCETTLVINKAILKLSKSKIVVVISHQMDVVKHSNQIVYIDSGCCYSGSHETLVDAHLSYKKLLAKQQEGAQDDSRNYEI